MNLTRRTALFLTISVLLAAPLSAQTPNRHTAAKRKVHKVKGEPNPFSAIMEGGASKEQPNKYLALMPAPDSDPYILRGIRRVDLAVFVMGDAENVVDTVPLMRRLQIRLREAGLEVTDQPERLTPTVMVTLDASVVLLPLVEGAEVRYIVHSSVSLRQPARVIGRPDSYIKGSTYEQTNMYKRNREELAKESSNVDSLIDGFLNEYLKANPKH